MPQNKLVLTEIAEGGVVCSHSALGEIAIIEPRKGYWYVRPLALSPTEYGRAWTSYKAARAYALALAYEQGAVEHNIA